MTERSCDHSGIAPCGSCKLEAEIERLLRGIKEIDRLLTEGRPADAHYICEAMYCGVDEQSAKEGE